MIPPFLRLVVLVVLLIPKGNSSAVTLVVLPILGDQLAEFHVSCPPFRTNTTILLLPTFGIGVWGLPFTLGVLLQLGDGSLIQVLGSPLSADLEGIAPSIVGIFKGPDQESFSIVPHQRPLHEFGIWVLALAILLGGTGNQRFVAYGRWPSNMGKANESVRSLDQIHCFHIQKRQSTTYQ